MQIARRLFRHRGPGFAFASLGIIGTWFAFAAWSQAAAAQDPQEKPVAVVRGRPLYEKDLLPEIQTQIYKIRKEEYERKLKAVTDGISAKLLQEEAQKHGVAEKEWLRQQVDSKVPEPTQEEVDQKYAEHLFQNASQSRDEVETQLKEDHLQQARDDYFQELREQAGVTIFLLPPAIAVGLDPARVRGNPDAKITIVEFSDFQCPFCYQAYSTMKDVLKKYAGKVKLAYRDLPLQEANGGVPGEADAARCAGEQGKFWEYHDLLFEHQDDVGPEAFQEYAARLRLSPEQFTSCLESGKFKAAIHEDFQEAIRLGITGTPAFFINGVPINGAQPKSEFEKIIDTELAMMEP